MKLYAIKNSDTGEYWDLHNYKWQDQLCSNCLSSHKIRVSTERGETAMKYLVEFTLKENIDEDRKKDTPGKQIGSGQTR